MNSELVFAIGDIHGNFDILRKTIKKHKLKNFVGFVCGDFGVGFNYYDPTIEKTEKRQLSGLNTFLKNRNVMLYVIAGNHDNPMFFDGNHDFTNIIFMKSYDVVNVNGYNYLGIGGAISVDRNMNYNFPDKYGRPWPGRKEGFNWWKDEKVVYKKDILNDLTDIDFVLTHTCPDFVYPNILDIFVMKWIQYDPKLEKELAAERKIMNRVYNTLKKKNTIKAWYYGHFHTSHFQVHESTKFYLLDKGEFKEIIIENGLLF